MKNILSALFACFLFMNAANAQIVITEIMYNPPESGTDSLEYIELYNNGSNPVNLDGWSFMGVTYTFSGFTLNPGQYVLVAENAAAMLNQFGATAFQWDGALGNNGELLQVLDNLGNVVDAVDYKDLAPWPSEPDGNGPSLVLCDPNADNNDGANWSAATTPTGVVINGIEILASPGYPMNCPSGIQAQDDQAATAPWSAAVINVLANDFIPGNLGSLTITTNPVKGSAVVTGNNTILYTPNENTCGADSLTYQVCEAGGPCASAKVYVTVYCYEPKNIAEVTEEDANGVATSRGLDCELEANVYGGNLRPTGLQFTIIDDLNTGIAVFRQNGNTGYNPIEGDKVIVRGVINQFNGLTQIFADTVIKVSSANPLVNPATVVKPAENTESSLIRINNLRLVNPVQWNTGQGSGFSAFAVSDDHPQDTVQIRIDNDVADLFNAPPPQTPFNLTGIGGQFDTSNPYTSDYQIQPRYMADLDPIVSVKEADLSAIARIQPNPFSDFLSLYWEEPVDRVLVINAYGARMTEAHHPNGVTRFAANEWPAGVYFIRIEKGNAFWTTRIVKQ